MKTLITTSTALLAVCTALALTGCGNAVKSSDQPADSTPLAPTPKTAQDKRIVTTDTSLCSQGAPLKSLQGAWMAQYKIGQLSFRIVFNFSHGILTLTNRCGYPDGSTIDASVGVPYTDANGQFSIAGTAHDTENIDSNGTHEDCSVSVSPRTISYTETGSCLEMHDPQTGESLTFVPANGL